jgi:iron complex outermembrane receptor protein
MGMVRHGAVSGAVSGLAMAVALSAALPAVAQDAAAPEEIIVTGLKRDEALIDVPVAVSVFDQQLITEAGITRPRDFLALVPNVTFIQSNHAGEAFVNVRGQTSVRQSESAVAVVIDGVQLATQNEFNGELFDIEQIEVLKGPQSAIYGRNATAGAIIINTRAPTDELEGEVMARYGNWNTANVQGSISGAIIPEKLRFRVAGAISTTDGPFQNINTGERVMRVDEHLIRTRFDWQAGPDTTVDMRGNYSRLTGGAIAFNAQVVGTTQGGVFTSEIDTNDTSLPWTTDAPGLNQQERYGASVKVDHDFGGMVLTSITSYSAITDNYQAKNYPYGAWNFPGNDWASDALSPGLDLDIVAAFGDNTQKFRIANRAFIQELRLTSDTDGRLRWQGGIFFLKARRQFTTEQGLNGRIARNPDGSLRPPFVIAGTNIGAPVAPVERTIIGGGVIAPTRGIDGVDSNNPTLNYDDNMYRTTNVAPFANAQFDITEDLEIQVAGRFDIEKRSIETLTPDMPNPFFGVAPGAPAATYNLCVAYTGRAPDDCYEDQTFKQFQPKINLIWKRDRGSFYTSWGQGFKSGGFNPIGTRDVLIQGLPNILVQDAFDKEVSSSWEAGFKSQLFDRRLNFNGAVFITNVKNSQQFEFFPTGGIQAISQLKKVGIVGIEFDANGKITDWLSAFFGFGYVDAEIDDIDDQTPAIRDAVIGNKAPYVADHNITAGLQMDQPISTTLAMTGRLEFNRTGRIWFDAFNSPNTSRDPINLVNARLGVVHDRWEIVGWSRNLLNKSYNADAVVILPVAHAVFRAQPRSFGIEGRIRF